MSDKNKYNDTMLLPKTEFGMRGKLPTEEIKMLDYWDRINLRKKIKEQSKNDKKFILHDGPPYANGPIHIGTAANKILKDIINRTMQFEGYNALALYVPGWDCHGLPIEWQIEKNYRKKGLNKEDVSIKEFRNECRMFARKGIDIQKQSFIRLFVLADWEKPYLTMDYETESIILKEFSNFFLKGSIYRGSKPVMWSPVEKTALAEAEIEYKDIESTSIFVSFIIKETELSLLKDTNIIIWTTTPWTIPGNRAIAYGKDIKYVQFEVIESDNSNLKNLKYLVAESLLDKVMTTCKISKYNIIKVVTGNDLKGTICIHPFHKKGYEYDIPLIEANFVEETDGTGFVHIAPSYGEDDYYLAKENNIIIEDIVKDDGCYKEDTPIFSGIHVFKAHTFVIEELEKNNSLIGIKSYSHSYPHSWRSKKPIIFRTTPQWFISMDQDNLRSKAMQSIKDTRWIPNNSRNRISSMVENRPDWCISRQRAWGVPITIFINKKNGEPLKDADVMEKIILDVKQKGSDVWLSEDPYKYLGEDKKPEDYEVVKDILDVWFDSGASHAYVLEKNDLQWPADLYLEGTDQHRGFFQSSLLEACGTRGKAPFKTVITHGFVLDGQGRKMSKSLGNVINPEDIIKKSGADILRLWVANTDYSEDMRIGDEVLSNLNDNYRRIRNTFRFILGNIGNISSKDCLDYDDLEEIDKYILSRIYELNVFRSKAIQDYSFHNFYKSLFEFCSVDLSAFYFDISKDILYCNEINDSLRKSKTTVLFYIFESLTTWYAPVLCHTMEEVWKCFKSENIESIHLKRAKKVNKKWEDNELNSKWNKIKKIRKVVNTAIELARNEKKIGSSLETEVFIKSADDNLKDLVESVDMNSICLVSSLKISAEKEVASGFISEYKSKNDNIDVYVFKTEKNKCLRCWQHKDEVKLNSGLCDRCKKIIELSL